MNKDDRTSAIKNYQFYVNQEREAGRQPLSFANWTERMKRAGATTISLERRADVDILKRFRGPEYVDRIKKEELGDPLSRFISDVSPARQKLRLRQRVLSDLKRAFPGSEITGKADKNGVVFYKDGERVLVWTDPDLSEYLGVE